MREPQNDDLLTRLQAGDERALTDLAETYGSKIYQLAFRYLRNREDAEEVTQDVLYKVYSKVGAFRGDAALSSWIYRIALNTCNTRLRSRSRYTISIEEQREASGFELAAETEDLGSGIQQEQVTRHVRRALQGLPAEMRQVIIMKEYEGLKFSEIADVLGIPISTVKTRMYTGLTELRKRLEHLREAV